MYGFKSRKTDKLNGSEAMAKAWLMRKNYNGEKYLCKIENIWREKKVEDLAGYDVYHVYVCIHKKVVYFANAWIVDKNGQKTNFILKRILRTRCNTPKLWIVLFDVTTGGCEIIQKHLPTYFESMGWWTHPDLDLPDMEITWLVHFPLPLLF